MKHSVGSLIITISPGALCVPLPEFQALLREAIAQQEAAADTKNYAERIRLEAEYYGLDEATIRAWDAYGVPWRRVIRKELPCLKLKP